MAAPLVQTAARGGLGKLRVKRQKDQLAKAASLDLFYRLRGERMPVAHGDEDARVEAVRFAEVTLERAGLQFGQFANRRLTANRRVVLLDVPRATARNQPRQRGPRQAREREVNNVGVGKQVVKKRLDGLERIRPAQLKDDDGYRFLPQNPALRSGWAGVAQRMRGASQLRAISPARRIPAAPPAGLPFR